MYTENIFYALDTTLHMISCVYFFMYAVQNNALFFLFISAFSECKIGLIAHEGCHQAISRNYGYLYDIFFSSSEMWIEKHNKKHHLYTNKEEDPDINIDPFLRITYAQPIFWYHKYQHIYQYLLFTLGAFSLRIQGLYYISKKSNTVKLYHIILNIPYLLVFIIYPVMKWNVYGIVFNIIQNMLVGLFYGIIFSVSHVNEKVLFDDNETIFEIIQLNETADWSNESIFWNYVTNGLNHQVIHHVKPKLSSYNYPLYSKIFKSKYPKKYKTFENILYAVKSNYNHMKKLGNFKCKVINSN